MSPAQLKKLSSEEAKLLASFIDLLEKTLDLDPAKRILPKDVLVVSYARYLAFLVLIMSHSTRF